MAETHCEFPMFSNQLACGRRRARTTLYSWWRDVTCKPCIKRMKTEGVDVANQNCESNNCRNRKCRLCYPR